MLEICPDILCKIGIFEQLSKPVRNCLLSKAYVRDYAPGTTLNLQGDATKALKIVLSGWLKLYRISPSGNEAILETLTVGESFDEIAALETGYCSSSAETVTNCRVMHIEIAAICSCKDARQELTRAVMLATSNRLEGMTRQVEHLKIKSCDQRLASFLVEQSGARQGTIEFELPYGKWVLAAELGMKPESLSRAFSRLKSMGVRSKDRIISIDDIARLRIFSSEGISIAMAAA